MSNQALISSPIVAANPDRSEVASTPSQAANRVPQPSKHSQRAGIGQAWVASLLVHLAMLLCTVAFLPTLSTYCLNDSVEARTLTPLSLSYENGATLDPNPVPASEPLTEEDITYAIVEPLPEFEVLEHPIPMTPLIEENLPEPHAFEPAPAAATDHMAKEFTPADLKWKRPTGGGSFGNRSGFGEVAGGGGGHGSGTLGSGAGLGGGNGSNRTGGASGAPGFGAGLGQGTGQGVGNGAGKGVGAVRKGPTRSVRVVKELMPVYPEAQRRAGRMASVLLEILIDEHGIPATVNVLTKEVPEDFVRSALAAAKSARYEPALEEGTPVPSYVRRRIEFRLE